ncbi:MAG: hypothetical protein KDA84_22940, partial [Planctomycetaceae bacterium]|nr:hypothetical protein [Planctomycetaceae bacterium]
MTSESPTTPSPEKATSPTPVKPSKRRVWLFRLGAVGFGVFLVVMFEVICWCFDWGQPSHAEDPFVGFREIHPLFELDATGDDYAIPPSRLSFFAPESFPAKKGKNTYRIFCLGGSTVQGRPWSKETSFTTFLEMALNEADPSRNWEVINCGGVSYASYRLVPILQECLNYEPDLFILCTGHNEFLEERTYGHIKHAPPILAVPQRWFGGSRTFTLVRQVVRRVTGQSTESLPENRPSLGGETQPILDYHDSLQAYHRDPAWRAGVVAHYESNLARMIAIAQQAEVPIVVVLPPSNLGDSPPFKSEHREGLSAEEQEKFDRLYAEARERYRSDLSGAIAKLKLAIQVDDQFAAAWYELGQCYRTRGLATQAREAFIKARDEDICPLRILSPMEESLKRVVKETDTPWLDAHALLEADCRQHILDGKRLIDHVHPTITGYQKIADALLEQLAEQGIVHPKANWQDRVHPLYEKHVQELDDLYFGRATENLEALR